MNDKLKEIVEFTEDGLLISGIFISKDEINEQISSTKVNNSDIALVEFAWDGYRGFDGCYEYLYGDKLLIDELVNLMLDVDVNFGEIAGKHSEVYGTLESEDITVTTDKDKLTKFINDNPKCHEYDHSFIFQMQDGVEQEYIEEESYNRIMEIYHAICD